MKNIELIRNVFDNLIRVSSEKSTQTQKNFPSRRSRRDR